MRQQETVWKNSFVRLSEVYTDPDAAIKNNNGEHPSRSIDAFDDVKAQQPLKLV